MATCRTGAARSAVAGSSGDAAGIHTTNRPTAYTNNESRAPIFNLFGEPLVCTPRDAVRSLYSSGIDVMFVGNFFLQK